MRIFITGASGYFGGVLTEHLISAGHTVEALARSERAGARVAELGATPVAGGLADTAVLHEAAARNDAVVHAAVDYGDPAMQDVEQPALDALLTGLADGRPFVYTSTGMVYPDTKGRPVTEDEEVSEQTARQPHKYLGERRVLAATNLAVTVVRAGLIYGRGGSALLQGLIAGARAQGVATYVGDGRNTWSTVHVDDLAALYAAVLTGREGGGAVNAATRTGTAFREMVEAVATLTGTRTASMPLNQATQLFGDLARTLTGSTPLDPSRAERLYGWKPAGPSLVEDVTRGSYAAA
ncbi:NAD-dependent epimerase/dehydratase family protein [Nonomuraea sp. NPDC004580]|uniref:NAD-dependent epimerase/dehydratase family protein n=1 Tax=Nonomuraea sp. NPDC004580 TaxID=3154552 RepID=UPI0033AA6B06